MKKFKEYQLTKILLLIGSIFFFLEFILHLFGLGILEHDKIFLYTHDRYIALFALTYSVLLFLIYTDIKKYTDLFKLTMIGILLSFINAIFISYQGGYEKLFPVNALDYNLSLLGLLFLVWYLSLIILYKIKN